MRISSLPPRRHRRPNGPVKPLSRMVWDRFAPRRFQSDDVPDEELQTILTLAAQAPSGFNLQPWRFVVVREREQRDRLRSAASDQSIIAEAPVVVAAYGLRETWEECAGEAFDGAAAGDVFDMAVAERQFAEALDFVRSQDIAVWLTRHVMIAFTYMMVAAEALGWDTAPMEGFDPAAVRSVLQLPDDAEVVALLAIGRLADPAAPAPSNRLPLAKLACAERHGVAWRDSPYALG